MNILLSSFSMDKAWRKCLLFQTALVRLLGIMIVPYWLAPKVIGTKVNIALWCLNDADMTSCLSWQDSELWSWDLTAVSGDYFPIGLLAKDNHCHLLQVLHSTTPLRKREQNNKAMENIYQAGSSYPSGSFRLSMMQFYRLTFFSLLN